MPLFTTSRKPCARTRTFLKELARVIPNSEVISRGKQSIHELSDKARQLGFDRVAVVTDMHGNPHSMQFLTVSESEWNWPEKKYVFKSVKLSRDFVTRVKKTGTLSIEGNKSLAKALGIEAEESETVLNETKDTITFFQNNKEVGPRMVLK